MSNLSRRTLLAGTGALALGAPFATRAHGAPVGRQFAVVTANIGREHKQHRESAIGSVRTSLNNAFARPVVGWQEIAEADGDTKESAWIREKFAEQHYAHRYLGGDSPQNAVPLSVPKEFDIVGKGSIKTHSGRESITPHRYVNWVTVQWHGDPDLSLVFVNTHFISGAFNDKYPKSKAWRRARWDEHFTALKQKIRDLREPAAPVIWTGDVNRPSMPVMFPENESRPFGSGIDQIGIVNHPKAAAAVRYAFGREKSRGSIDLKVDSHDARYVKLEITKR